MARKLVRAASECVSTQTAGAGGGSSVELYPGTIAASATGSTTISVTQTAAPSGGSGSITVALYRHTASFTPPGTGTLVATSLPFSDSGLDAETAYYYEAVYTSGALTGNSNEVNATTTAGATILWSSNWATGTGTGRDAVEDGTAGSREFYRECSSTTNVANVIAGDSVDWTLTDNCLEVTKRGANCTQIWASSTGAANTVPGLSDRESYYVRLYIRADLTVAPFHPVTNPDGEDWANHPIAAPETADIECRHWAPREVNLGDSTYRARMHMDNPSSGLNTDGRWSSPTLDLETWYRFEWFHHFYDASNVNRYRIYCRIYTLAGALLHDTDDFRRSPETSPGDLVQTLQEWYDAGGYFSWAAGAISNSWGLGYEGPALASDTGEHVYMASPAIGTGDWIGGV